MLRQRSSQLRPRPSSDAVLRLATRLAVYRRLAASRMQTGLSRSSAHTRTDKKTSTRKISWTDSSRVYHNAQVYHAYTTTRRQIYVSESRRCSGSSRRLPASSRILSLHTLQSRHLGTWGTSWIDYASRENHPQAILFASYRQEKHRDRSAARRSNNLHNPIRRPKSTPSCAPECFTQTVAYRKCRREPR